MHQNPMELRCVREAIPIHLLHLPGFVGIEEEVAAGGAPRERQDGARIDNAGSGHAPSIEANAVPNRCLVISVAWQLCDGGFMSGRRRAALCETTP